MKRLHPLALPQIQRKGRTLRGQIVHMDAFGNLITNIPGSLLVPTRSFRPALRYRHHTARMVSSYAAGRPDELIGVVNSLGFFELAIRNGSAAWSFNARRGDDLRVLA